MSGERDSLKQKLAIAALLFFFSMDIQVFAANIESRDLLDMSLDELLKVEISELNPMNIHHIHDKGESMIGYSFSFIKMAGNRDGRSHISAGEVLGNFMVSPTEMTVRMHMLELMYVPTDKTTVMIMLPYILKTMKHVNRSGVEFRTRSEGPGDLKTSVMYSIRKNKHYEIYISGGIGFPTGSVNREDSTPTGRARLSYPMQIGSGTYDLLPGMAYLATSKKWSWGLHIGGVIRTGKNVHHYRLGDEYKGTMWLTRNFSEQLSTHVRLDSKIWDNIHNKDHSLSPTMVPTADPHLRGGKRTDIGFGINLLGTRGATNGHRLSVEYRIPLYQSLDGPQLETDWILSVGWQKVF